MTKTLLFFAAFAGFMFSGCASDEKINLIHVHEAKNFSETKDVFYSNDNMNTAVIPALLNKKLNLPRNVKIAIIKLKPKDDGDYRVYRLGNDPTMLAARETAPFLAELLKDKNVTTLIVPESLIPAKANLRWMRNLGATMKADLVLVVDSRNDRYADMQIIKDDLAMSVASADAYLIDTRTGSILEANSYTDESIAKKSADEPDPYFTLDRARISSEKKIYRKLAADVHETITNLR